MPPHWQRERQVFVASAPASARPLPPATVGAPLLRAVPVADLTGKALRMSNASKFEGMTGEQVKASVYGYAGDLRDDKISAEEMTAIVGEAAQRLGEEDRASLERLLRIKVGDDVADEVVAPLGARGGK